METEITLGDLKREMARYQLDDAEFTRVANRVCKRYMESDVYTTYFSELIFDASSGYIVVPREFGKVYGVVADDMPMPVFSPYCEWHEYGFGRQDPAKMSLNGLIDDGFRWATQKEIVTAGTLRLKIDDADDADKVVRFTALDANGERIFEDGKLGFELTIASPSADTTQVVSRVDGIIFPDDMAGGSTLWVVNGTTETQIGKYEPGEIRPRYHRYKMAKTTKEIRCYCRRRHVPLVHDTDWVYPGNILAIEYGFEAMDDKDGANSSGAAEAWAAGKQILAEELASINGNRVTFLVADHYEGMRHSPAAGNGDYGRW